nr:GDP-mannose 4,6-dehydratase [Desulfobacteraceae bacterium]
YGDGKNVRDWLYVDDHCSAIWEIIKHGREGETYNIGGDCELENIKLVEMICDAVDEKTGNSHGHCRELITFVKDRPGHDQRYAIDATKIKTELGWAPKTPVETGILSTITWYLENENWVNRVRSGAYREWIQQQYQ